jgi:hypothetical protein
MTRTKVQTALGAVPHPRISSVFSAFSLQFIFCEVSPSQFPLEGMATRTLKTESIYISYLHTSRLYIFTGALGPTRVRYSLIDSPLVICLS